MGTLYYAVCHDCAEVLDLGKFWSWRVVKHDTPSDELEQEIEKEIKRLFDYFDSDDVGNVGDKAGHYRNEWIYCAVHVLAFLSVHNGHRISIVDEHSGLHRITRMEKMEMAKEPDATICMCGHHFRVHVYEEYLRGRDNEPNLGSCSLCKCEKFVQ